MGDRISLLLLTGSKAESDRLECGDRTECCTTFRIETAGFRKDESCACPHLFGNESGNGKTGCTIYSIRPEVCRAFKCHWLQGKVMMGKKAYRPDKLGLIFKEMEDFPLKGMLGVFRTGTIKTKLGGRARAMLRHLEQITLFYFEERIFGPLRLIDQWKEATGIDKQQQEKD